VDVTGTFDFTAPAEVVYNTLTDHDRAERWLPSGVRTQRLAPRLVRVDTAAGSTEYEISTAPENLRLDWRGLNPPYVHGTASVENRPAGGSRVRVIVAAPDGGPDPEVLWDLLKQAMEHLRRDVSDNLNPG
jgi:Polyketide cyclase / dehydrase and lipid transport